MLESLVSAFTHLQSSHSLSVEQAQEKIFVHAVRFIVKILTLSAVVRVAPASTPPRQTPSVQQRFMVS